MPVSEEWIGHREIRDIEGSLKPSAYVGRAYRYSQDNGGQLPEWARKQDNGRWQFHRAHIEADAGSNLKSLGIDEAAHLLGTTKRTVQTWCDEGIISAASTVPRAKGESRRIVRDQFMKELPSLRRRLEVGSTEEKEVTAREKGGAKSVRTAVSRELPQDAPISIKAQSAAAVEAQLQSAKEARRQEDRWEQLATESAQRIMNDMFDGQFNRVEALVLFNQAATDQGVPDDIRIRVRKGFFGK